MTPHWLLKQTLFAALLDVDVEAVLSEGVAKLAAQGSPHQIAHYLQDQGVTGVRGQAYECPVARYLDARLGISESAVLVNLVRAGVPLMSVTMRIPSEVGAFVREFDGGQFNELLPWTPA